MIDIVNVILFPFGIIRHFVDVKEQKVYRLWILNFGKKFSWKNVAIDRSYGMKAKESLTFLCYNVYKQAYENSDGQIDFPKLPKLETERTEKRQWFLRGTNYPTWSGTRLTNLGCIADLKNHSVGFASPDRLPSQLIRSRFWSLLSVCPPSSVSLPPSLFPAYTA